MLLSKFYSSKAVVLRRGILFLFDYFIVLLCICFPDISDSTSGFYIHFFHLDFFQVLFLFLAPLFYIFTGQYKGITRYSSSKSFYYILLRNLSLFLITYFVSFLLQKTLPSLSQSFNLFIYITFVHASIRVIFRDFFLYYQSNKAFKSFNVAIYGSGPEAVQLASSLRQNRKYRIVCFIDHNNSLAGQNLFDIPIYIFDDANYENLDLQKVFIASPTLSKSLKRYIVNYLMIKNI